MPLMASDCKFVTNKHSIIITFASLLSGSVPPLRDSKSAKTDKQDNQL